MLRCVVPVALHHHFNPLDPLGSVVGLTVEAEACHCFKDVVEAVFTGDGNSRGAALNKTKSLLSVLDTTLLVSTRSKDVTGQAKNLQCEK